MPRSTPKKVKKAYNTAITERIKCMKSEQGEQEADDTILRGNIRHYPTHAHIHLVNIGQRGVSRCVFHQMKRRADGDYFTDVETQMAAPRLGVRRPNSVRYVPNRIETIHKYVYQG